MSHPKYSTQTILGESVLPYDKGSDIVSDQVVEYFYLYPLAIFLDLQGVVKQVSWFFGA